MKQVLTQREMTRQSVTYQGTGGVSAGNRGFGFVPAFLDRSSGCVHLSCGADGQPAAIHRFDGLPDEVVLSRDECGCPLVVKPSLIAGFVRDGVFFTREQAAALVEWELDKVACQAN